MTIRSGGRDASACPDDKAFALIDALDATQRSQAILNYRVADLVLGPGQDGRTVQPEGLRASSLTAAQQTQLLDESVRARLPEMAALRERRGAIAIAAEGRFSSLSVGTHRLVFRNETTDIGSVFLANALVPERREIAVTGQVRTPDQR